MLFGARVARVEDSQLVTGRGTFVDDIEPEGTLHLALVRSPVAHGEITGIDLDGLAPGVQAFTDADLPVRWKQVIGDLPERTALANGVVRYVGEPVVAVIAEDRHQAWDVAADVWVEYADRPSVIGTAAALAAGAPLVYPELGSNLVYRSGSGPIDGLFDGADVVMERTFSNHRIAPGMLETRGILAVPDEAGTLVVYCSHQSPHGLRDQLAAACGIAVDDLRVVVPDVGGGFGSKASFYPEYPLAALLALRTGRPVKFVETRTENLAVAAHGRGQTTTVTLGATADGAIVGLRFRTVGDMGAAVDNQRWCLHLTEQMVSGCYVIPRIEREILGVLTHTAPVGAFRGAGRPEAAFALEHAVDQLARRLEIDPVELRRRNLIDPDSFPYETGLGSIYDSGSYRVALDLACERLGYEAVRAEQRVRGDGVLVGVGVASYVELSGGGQEYGEVGVLADGTVTVKTGTSPHGQGHRTTWAQIAADELGVPLDAVTVLHGDTAVVPRGGGTSGSRSAALGGTAVGLAAAALADRIRELTAERLEADRADIRLVEGSAVVAGTDVGVTFAELAESAGGILSESTDFVTPGLNYPFGTHGCVVEIDRTTGEVAIRSYVAVDDCGRVINPVITEGQVHGGICQGVAHALFEGVRHDASGNLVTANWSTYRIPALTDLLPIDAVRTETPTPNNPLGLKGVGEVGATGSTPAVANAVMDALTRAGVDEDAIGMPYTPDKVWAALQEVRE